MNSIRRAAIAPQIPAVHVDFLCTYCQGLGFRVSPARLIRSLR